MQPSATDSHLRPLLCAGMQQSWKPGQRHTDDAAICERDPHAIGVEMNLSRFRYRNSHTSPSQSVPCSSRPHPATPSAFARHTRHCRRRPLQEPAKIWLPGHPSRCGYAPARAAHPRSNKRRIESPIAKDHRHSEILRHPRPITLTSCPPSSPTMPLPQPG
jgi:hypothetical protein